jgi:hypothetical protein
MKIELLLDDKMQSFLSDLQKERNELVVPIGKWNEHIRDNARIKPKDIPPHIFADSYVITERRWFQALVSEQGNLFFTPKRLTREEGGFWFADKLELKKNMAKHDIFDVGNRQQGSFRSKY